MIDIFQKIYEKSIDPEVVKIYHKLCQEIPDEQTNHIIRECLKACLYFPRPADIFKYYDEYPYREKNETRKTSVEELEAGKKGVKIVLEGLEKLEGGKNFK